MNHKQEDCYFFYNSTCTRGDRCRFRHCELAKGSKTVCKFWLENRCLNEDCRFRHTYIKKNCREIPCRWENQPDGCQKQDCSFKHQKPRTIRQHTVLQAKSQLSHVREDASGASLRKSQSSRTESPTSEKLNENPLCDMNPDQKRKPSGSVCSADAEQPNCKCVKENQPDSCRKQDSNLKPKKPQFIRRHTVLQAKSLLSPVQGDASLSKLQSTRTESSTSEKLNENPPPSDVNPGQKREYSGSVCSADAEQPLYECVKENQPGSCGKHDSDFKLEKPQSIRECTVLQAKNNENDISSNAMEKLQSSKTESPTSEKLNEIPPPSDVKPGLKRECSGSVSSADAEQPHYEHVKKEYSDFKLEKPQSIRECSVLQAKESPTSETLNENPPLSNVKPGQKRKRSGSVYSADAEPPPCKRFKKEDSDFKPEKAQSFRRCIVLPARVDEIKFITKALEELKLEDSVKTHVETAGSPASKDLNQSLSAMKTPSEGRSGRKRKAAQSIFSNGEPPCKRAKLHHI